MKFLILFFLSGVLCELPVATDLPILEPETLTDLPGEQIHDFGGVTVPVRQNDLEVELDKEEAVVIDEGAISIATIETTTVHFTQEACTGENMEWNTCGPRCYQTCAFQPRGIGREKRSVCEVNPALSGCYPGCYCKSGYVRLNSKCVLSADCPTRTCLLLNEDYEQCGTPCPITCDNHHLADKIGERCPTEICVRGCFCKEGTIRNAAGFCVLPNRCPRPLII